MVFNFYAILVATLIAFAIGSIWYHPKVFGTIWMKEAGLTEEELQKGNMLKIFGLSIIFSFMLALTMPILVVHQMGALSMIGGPDSIQSALPSYQAFMNDYGTTFRTFKHGALHGFMSSLFIALPIVGMNGLFEQKSWKYIFVHTGYWMLVMTIMGSIVGGWI